MNFAGVRQAPVVLFCQNNQWAISVPSSHQSKSETIAIKADAYWIRMNPPLPAAGMYGAGIPVRW
jgi:TPP-dependent pyruvate/acetoin dehydrogenase alpha subunit